METDTVVVGAGSVGLAVAYYLSTRHGVRDVVVVDPLDPMALTSAQSGENYRNWWPHPVMTAFTDASITLMEALCDASGDRLAMTRRGYALATRRADALATRRVDALATRRADAGGLVAELYAGYGPAAAGSIRVHDRGGAYRPAVSAGWRGAPDGVDVLLDPGLIRAAFPAFAPDITAVLHIRRAGAISGQQQGQMMLEAIRAGGGQLRRARVTAVEPGPPFTLRLDTPDGPATLRAARLVNAAGPFVAKVAGMLGETLPVTCVFQQKIAFEDRAGAVPRDMPFAIDLDGQHLAWTGEERDLLAADPEAAALLGPMPGGIHCRPDGGDGGRWIKLGWATNRAPGDPAGPAPLDPHFPDLVLRAAGRLLPGLHAYLGRLPRNARHYGGYYTMTAENWPLIGPMQMPGAFVAGALAGFGTMAACAAGALCAAWVVDGPLPPYAKALSCGRYGDAGLMAALAALNSTGAL